MRFVRTVGALLLLTLGIPVLLLGSTLWLVAGYRDSGGAFTGSLERLETSGHAVVVPDLDALLRRDVPFLRTGSTRLRVTAQTEDGPAFLGVAPATEVARYLATAPHARLARVGVTRGPLPVRLAMTAPEQPAVPPAPPGTQTFWRHSAAGALDVDPERLRDRPMSLVVMRPDGAAGIGVEVRAEVRLGWLDPAMWGLLTSGVLLVLVAAVMLTRPVRPREIVFVVEPAQVPVLAARLGVATLDPANDSALEAAASPGAAPAGEPSPERERRSVPRPADLAEMLRAERRPEQAPLPVRAASTEAKVRAAPTDVHTMPRPFEGRPVPVPQPAWPPPALDRVAVAPHPKPQFADQSGPCEVQARRSPSAVGVSQVGAAERASAPVAPAHVPAAPVPAPVAPVQAPGRPQAPVRPSTGPARLRPSVPGFAGSANAVDLTAVRGSNDASEVRLGERSGPVKPTAGRHHAAAPVLPVRAGTTPLEVSRRNSGRGRWWAVLRRDRTKGPMERI